MQSECLSEQTGVCCSPRSNVGACVHRNSTRGVRWSSPTWIPRQPGLAGASDARADLAFNVLRGSYAPMLEHGTFQFKVEQQPICEGVARWLRGFHFGAQWDSQKERAMGGCTSARDENGQGIGLGKRARGGKMGVAPSEKCYKSGHIVAWLENLASLIGSGSSGSNTSRHRRPASSPMPTFTSNGLYYLPHTMTRATKGRMVPLWVVALCRGLVVVPVGAGIGVVAQRVGLARAISGWVGVEFARQLCA